MSVGTLRAYAGSPDSQSAMQRVADRKELVTGVDGVEEERGVLPADQQKIREAQLPAVVRVLARFQNRVRPGDRELRQSLELVAEDVPACEQRSRRRFGASFEGPRLHAELGGLTFRSAREVLTMVEKSQRKRD